MVLQRNRFAAFVCDLHFRAILLAIVAIFIGLVIPYMILLHFKITEKVDQPFEKCQLERGLRIDCLPGIPLPYQDEEKCESFGCCWNILEDHLPYCYHPQPSNYSYEVCEVEQISPSEYRIHLQPNFRSTVVQTEVLNDTQVIVQFQSMNHLRLLLYSPAEFNPPGYLLYKNEAKLDYENISYSYGVSFPSSGKFHLNVRRKNAKGKVDLHQKPIFNTIYGPFIVSKGLTELTTLLPSFDIYGIGQSPKTSFRHDLSRYKKYNLFSRSESHDELNPTVYHASGVHPFYLAMESDGQAHGVLLATNHLTEVITNGAPSITFRTSGAWLDFHIFLGPTPEEVIQQLTHFIGRPELPPYWSLGYHSCRMSDNLSIATDFLEFTRNQKIPHDSDCGTTNLFHSASNYSHSDIVKFTNSLKMSNKKFIVFHKPQISESDMSTLCEASAIDIQGCPYIVDSESVYTFKGYSEDGREVAYFDVFHPNYKTIVERFFQWLISEVSVEGILLDKNTPVSFNFSRVNGASCDYPRDGNGSFVSNDAFDGTVCATSRHFNNFSHYDLHNLYGYYQLLVARQATNFSKKRIFLSSLSTFIGSGAFGGHLSGPLKASWQTLKSSVVQMLDLSLFGIPLSGVPGCGTADVIDIDLCVRWLQVAAFQPILYTLNLNQNEQFFHGHKRLIFVARTAIQLRYSLLPYLYGLFYNASKSGQAVVKPLLLEFPNVRETYGIDSQFMWGSGLLISPILTPLTHSIRIFFPPGCWYNYYTGKKDSESRSGEYRTMRSIENHITLHVRGGQIIPSQPAALTTTESRFENLSLTIALNCLKKVFGRAKNIMSHWILATGEIYIDDGETRDTDKIGDYLLVKIVVLGRSITITPSIHNRSETYFKNKSETGTILNKINIYGLEETPAVFFVNGMEKIGPYNPKYETVSLDDLSLDLTKPHRISWKPYNQ